MPVALKLDQMR